MKRYKFGLGGVLRVQKIVEEQAQSARIAAQDDADRASELLHQRLEDIGAARSAPGLRTGSEFIAEREHLDRHRLAILAARSAEINALELLGTRHAEWTEAAKKVRALERLDERKHTEWVAQTTRAAQLVTDEIATIRYRTENG